MPTSDKDKARCTYCGAFSKSDLKAKSLRELRQIAKTLGLEPGGDKPEGEKERLVLGIHSKTKPYIYHRNRKKEIDYAVCLGCLKGCFDKILGGGKDGGRIE